MQQHQTRTTPSRLDPVTPEERAYCNLYWQTPAGSVIPHVPGLSIGRMLELQQGMANAGNEEAAAAEGFGLVVERTDLPEGGASVTAYDAVVPPAGPAGTRPGLQLITDEATLREFALLDAGMAGGGNVIDIGPEAARPMTEIEQAWDASAQHDRRHLANDSQIALRGHAAALAQPLTPERRQVLVNHHVVTTLGNEAVDRLKTLLFEVESAHETMRDYNEGDVSATKLAETMRPLFEHAATVQALLAGDGSPGSDQRPQNVETVNDESLHAKALAEAKAREMVRQGHVEDAVRLLPDEVLEAAAIHDAHAALRREEMLHAYEEGVANGKAQASALHDTETQVLSTEIERLNASRDELARSIGGAKTDIDALVGELAAVRKTSEGRATRILELENEVLGLRAEAKQR